MTVDRHSWGGGGGHHQSPFERAHEWQAWLGADHRKSFCREAGSAASLLESQKHEETWSLSPWALNPAFWRLWSCHLELSTASLFSFQTHDLACYCLMLVPPRHTILSSFASISTWSPSTRSPILWLGCSHAPAWNYGSLLPPSGSSS